MANNEEIVPPLPVKVNELNLVALGQSLFSPFMGKWQWKPSGVWTE